MFAVCTATSANVKRSAALVPAEEIEGRFIILASSVDATVTSRRVIEPLGALRFWLPLILL